MDCIFAWVIKWTHLKNQKPDLNPSVIYSILSKAGTFLLYEVFIHVHFGLLIIIVEDMTMTVFSVMDNVLEDDYLLADKVHL